MDTERLEDEILKVECDEKNYNGELQERVQKIYRVGQVSDLLDYEVIRIGGSGDTPSFKAVVRVRGKIRGEAIGTSKKMAKNAAAKNALERIHETWELCSIR